MPDGKEVNEDIHSPKCTVGSFKNQLRNNRFSEAELHRRSLHLIAGGRELTNDKANLMNAAPDGCVTVDIRWAAMGLAAGGTIAQRVFQVGRTLIDLPLMISPFASYRCDGG